MTDIFDKPKPGELKALIAHYAKRGRLVKIEAKFEYIKILDGFTAHITFVMEKRSYHRSRPRDRIIDQYFEDFTCIDRDDVRELMQEALAYI